MKNILVPIDFDGSEKSLIDKAIEIAHSFRSKVWLLHVAAPDPDFVGNDVGPQSVRDIRAETLREEHRALQEYADSMRAQNIDATALLIQGPTIEIILEESKKLNIDLLVASHHDHGLLYRALLGSVSNQLIKKSKIPVLVVPVD